MDSWKMRHVQQIFYYLGKTEAFFSEAYGRRAEREIFERGRQSGLRNEGREVSIKEDRETWKRKGERLEKERERDLGKKTKKDSRKAKKGARAWW